MNQIRENRAKQILRAGGTIYSSSVRLPESGLCELLGYAGFDFVLIDCEHGAADAATIDALVQGCFAGGTVPVVRVLRNDEPEAVMKALDLGAQGVLIPHCRTAADAVRLKQSACYPPNGIRGFGPGRGSKWGLVSSADYFANVDDSILTLALVEDPEGIENIDAIAQVGLDVLWVGTSDLACAYGVPGETSHPKVLAAASRVLEACLQHNIACGFPARDIESARWAKAQGYRAIGYGCAEQYVMQTSRRFLEGLEVPSGNG
ncbi:MAG: aldolase/citrate lyase family protein [Planctomycetota bacterium]|nr:aldolase/citrate lyase family protein [Planctomycetota bacterium]